MIPINGAEIGNHLWQSTLFVAVAWLLTLALQRNRASIRYWIWLAASLKFLVPLSLLVSIGSYLNLPNAPAIVQSNFSAIESFGRPLVAPASSPAANPAPVASAPVRMSAVPSFLLTVWFAGFAVVALSQYLRRRRLRAVLDEAQNLTKGREVEALRRVQSRRRCREPIYLASSLSALEPGVCGIFTHLLLLPADISERLDGGQLETVLAHEVAHVERRDNLLAAVHMMVEMVFWFHPLVWWIGSRMVEERERACDGDVLQSGGDAEAYAGAILKVCQYYLAPPLTGVAGITGSNLRKRVEDIMTRRTGENLDWVRKLLLLAAGASVVAVPILVGLINVTPVSAWSQSEPRFAFEAASVKLHKPGDAGGPAPGLQYLPGGRFTAGNMPIAILVMEAYGTTLMRPGADLEKKLDPRIGSDRYDVEAVAEKNAIPAGASASVRNETLKLMLRTLLADRFKLMVHRELKDGPVYALEVTRGGPKLKKAAMQENTCGDQATNVGDPAACHVLVGGFLRGMQGQAIDMSDFARGLTEFSDRPVIDKTGLTGLYNIQIEGWADIRNVPRPARTAQTEAQRAEDLLRDDPSRPTLFAVLDNLGLQLEPQTGPIQTLYVDYFERPSEN
jgi:bla regulator protein BlaR1